MIEFVAGASVFAVGVFFGAMITFATRDNKKEN